MDLGGLDELTEVFDGPKHENVLRLDGFAFYTIVQLFFYAAVERSISQEKGVFTFIVGPATRP